MTKFCGRCKEKRPVSDFNKDRSRKDGLNPICRDCTRERKRKYREVERKYREENRDYRLAIQRENRRKKAKVSASMATKSGPWSQEEVDLLIELHKTRTVYQCAIVLGRKYGSTQTKITKLRQKGIEI